ncbi:unnamed protein product [Heligmosomoides polygyrus]|uniref:Uncharacterized protein n=1 Tax=Heligmosomoides polygyrus TaxID=6339 RepID=A0A183FIN1_HELPZ|nr:unnamed protein product [Heligmosomoides polygyrus]
MVDVLSEIESMAIAVLRIDSPFILTSTSGRFLSTDGREPAFQLYAVEAVILLPLLLLLVEDIYSFGNESRRERCRRGAA